MLHQDPPSFRYPAAKYSVNNLMQSVKDQKWCLNRDKKSTLRRLLEVFFGQVLFPLRKENRIT